MTLDHEWWYDELAEALASRRIDKTRVEEILAEARAHCEATDESPNDAFGDPQAYAAHLTATDDPDETRFERVAEQNEMLRQPARYRVLATLGVSVAVVGAIGLLVDGTWRTVTTIDLLVWLVMFATISLAQLASDSRRAGHPSTARQLQVGWIAVAALCAVIGTFLPAHEILRVPLLAVLIAGIGLVAVGWWLGDHWLKAHPTATHLATDVWLDRLAGMLESRYRLGAGKAREFTAEAASHLAESGADPEQEFGPVENYAAELAERSGLYKPPPRWPVWVFASLATLTFGAFTAIVIANHGLLSIRTAILATITFLLASNLTTNTANHLRRTHHAARPTTSRQRGSL